MTKIGAAFSVRFLRNGDQISITRDILNQSGGGAGLFQTGQKQQISQLSVLD